MAINLDVEYPHRFATESRLDYDYWIGEKKKCVSSACLKDLVSETGLNKVVVHNAHSLLGNKQLERWKKIGEEIGFFTPEESVKWPDLTFGEECVIRRFYCAVCFMRWSYEYCKIPMLTMHLIDNGVEEATALCFSMLSFPCYGLAGHSWWNYIDLGSALVCGAPIAAREIKTIAGKTLKEYRSRITGVFSFGSGPAILSRIKLNIHRCVGGEYREAVLRGDVEKMKEIAGA